MTEGVVVLGEEVRLRFPGDCESRAKDGMEWKEMGMMHRPFVIERSFLGYDDRLI